MQFEGSPRATRTRYAHEATVGEMVQAVKPYKSGSEQLGDAEVQALWGRFVAVFENVLGIPLKEIDTRYHVLKLYNGVSCFNFLLKHPDRFSIAVSPLEEETDA